MARPKKPKENIVETPSLFEKDEEHGLTEMQNGFVWHYTEGACGQTEAARRAGYEFPSQAANKLLNGKDFPLVTEYIKELRDERERRYGVTLIGQLKRLSELSHKAEEEGQFSASINAEVKRSALGGLIVDRREQNHIHQLDKLSREEIVARLNQIRSEYPHAFIDGNFKKVEDVREEPLVAIEEKSTSKNTLSKN